MSRKQTKNKRNTKRKSDEGQSRLAVLTALGPTFCVIAVLGVTIAGLEQLRRHVYAQPKHNPPVTVELVVPPGEEWVEQEGWLPRIAGAIDLPEDMRLMSRGLLRSVADQMASSGWVREVEHVTRDMDGTVRVLCDYRRPIAMLHTKDDHYVAIDREGVRLPEVYESVSADLGWMRIIGIQSALPPKGRPFDESADDAWAGVQLARFLFDHEEIGNQISGIDMTNFRGRRDKYKTHIRLWTRDGRMAKWGSAIGEEIEEPTPEAKLRNLGMWLEKGGSPQAYADLSIYGNGWIEPVGQPLVKP